MGKLVYKSSESRLAFDRASVRSYDQDGRLHVQITNISKANICPYLGKEIPDSEKLGLDPDRVYNLLRDPEELAKSVPTWNNIPLLSVHKPVHVDDPKKELIVGSTGTDASFDNPYLRQSLVVWDGVAIAGIEDEEQKELSCGYRYRADMTPGVFEGAAYDGVMRDIRGNHVALVVEGRAGSDIVVGDSKLDEGVIAMSDKKFLSRKAALAKGALLGFLQPKLAADAKIDLNPVLMDVTPSNWKKSKAGIVAAVEKLTKGKLAADESVSGLAKLLDHLDGEEMGAAPPDGNPNPDDDLGNDDPDDNQDGAALDDPMDAVMQLLQSCNVPPEVLQKIAALMKPQAPPAAAPGAVPARDDPPATPGAAAVPRAAPAAAPAQAGLPDKAAMDKAISKAKDETKKETMKLMRDIATAQQEVFPHVGEVQAMDSAEDVYRVALEAAEVDLEGVPSSAFKAMVGMLPKPGETQPNKKRIAQDSANVIGLRERFPDIKRVRNLG